MQTQNTKLHIHINIIIKNGLTSIIDTVVKISHSSEMEANQGEDGRWFSGMSGRDTEGRCPRLVGVIFIAKEVIVDIELKLIACIVGIVLGALFIVYVRVQLVQLWLCLVSWWVFAL